MGRHLCPALTLGAPLRPPQACTGAREQLRLPLDTLGMSGRQAGPWVPLLTGTACRLANQRELQSGVPKRRTRRPAGV